MRPPRGRGDFHGPPHRGGGPPKGTITTVIAGEAGPGGDNGYALGKKRPGMYNGDQVPSKRPAMSGPGRGYGHANGGGATVARVGRGGFVPVPLPDPGFKVGFFLRYFF